MNNNLLEIIKKITAEHGEDILSDPKKLKAFVSDYAKDEPKEDRVAFGRAIENGFYAELKTASSANRTSVKASLVTRLQGITGFDIARCTAAVDLLEAAIYGRTASAPVKPTQITPKAQNNEEKPVFCSGCGCRLPTGSKFCLSCGTKVGEQVSTPDYSGGTSKLIVERRKGYVGVFAKIKVFIDGKFIVELKNGDTQDLQIHNGKHYLYCESFGAPRSESIEINAMSNKTVISVSFTSFSAAMLNSGIERIFITKILETPAGIQD